MPTYRVINTGSSGNDGSSWALSKDKLTSFDSVDVADDTALLASTHSESTAGANIVYLFAGTTGAPTRILSVSTSSENPAFCTKGAAIATTGTADIRVAGHVYVNGVSLTTSDAASLGSIVLNNTTTGAKQVYENCDFYIRGTHGAAILTLGSATNGNGCSTSMKNCTFRLSSTGQQVQLNAVVDLEKVSFAVGSLISAAGVFNVGGGSNTGFADIRNSDFSNLSASASLVATPPATRNGEVRFLNCTLPVGWATTGNLLAGASLSGNFRAEMHNCSAGTTKIFQRVETGFGSSSDSQTIYRTAGLVLAGIPVSFKITGSASAKYPSARFDSAPMARHYPGDAAEDAAFVAGATKTVTVELLHDIGVTAGQGAGSGFAFRNDEVALEVSFFNTAGASIYDTVTNLPKDGSGKPDPLVAPTDIPSSTAAWTTTGMTTPAKQKISLDITPQEKGTIVARLVMMKAGKVVYACGKMTVS